MTTEKVELAGVSSVGIKELSGAISPAEPRYSFFRYFHELDGETKSPIIFISSCPSGLKVKERMLYAASRAVFLDSVRKEVELEVSKKVGLAFSSPTLGLLKADRIQARSLGPLRDQFICSP